MGRVVTISKLSVPVPWPENGEGSTSPCTLIAGTKPIASAITVLNTENGEGCTSQCSLSAGTKPVASVITVLSLENGEGCSLSAGSKPGKWRGLHALSVPVPSL